MMIGSDCRRTVPPVGWPRRALRGGRLSGEGFRVPPLPGVPPGRGRNRPGRGPAVARCYGGTTRLPY
eukprot:438825-Hanusia_phi.AAC.1